MTLAGKTFRAIANTSNGTLNPETTMSFVSDNGAVILGIYHGGAIRTGQVIAHRVSETMAEMLYHCVTTAGELKAGQAQARFTDDGRQMHLDWQWLTGDRTAGCSAWILEPV